MHFSYEIIEPQDVRHPDTLVLYPMPIFANMQNTGSRLQKTADLTGLPIVASDLFFQNKKTVFDMAAKSANRPWGDQYRDMSRRRSDFFEKIAEKHGAAKRIGFGDSLGVAAIQGMHLHSETPELFNAALLRDGWNLNRPAGIVSGVARYLGYQIRDVASQKLARRSFDVPTTAYDTTPKEPSEVGFFGTLYNVSDTMRGSHNRDNALVLAALPRIALKIVCLDHGLSGSKKNQRIFIDELTAARQTSSFSGEPAGLIASIDQGWHSDLLDPARAAQDLAVTLAQIK